MLCFVYISEWVKKLQYHKKTQHLIKAIFELRTKTSHQNKLIPKTAAFSRRLDNAS